MPSILSNKEKLQEAIEKTNSTSEALVYLGLRNAGGNFQTFHKYCSFYGLTEKDPLPARIHALKRQHKIKIPLEELLVTNSKIKNPELKSRLVDSGLLKNICSICGLLPEWNGKKLTLQLDHINGIHSDNRIENLRILCPNCHTQTDNFGSKNTAFNKIKYTCTVCNDTRVKDSKSKLCFTCSSKKRRKILDRPEKETIRKQVEELGYCGTARLYGVSDNAIRKWL